MGAFPEADITVQELGCRRGGRLVFAGLSFSLSSGEAMLLGGANGSGKSSLLRVLAYLIRPAAGSVLWCGANVAADLEAYRAQLRFVSHQDAVKPALLVKENLAFAAGLGEPTITSAAVGIALDAMELGPLADLPAQLLSAGQRRRLALARLAAAPAPLWLLDEPGSGLDKPSLARLHQLIATHRHQGGIVIASSHGDLDMPDCRHLDMNTARAAA
jgi:heme exporter protein A